MENVQIIQNFINAWSRLDADELVSYFTEDGIYHNMPAAPVQDRKNLTEFISGFLANWTKTSGEAINIVGNGDIVIAARLDRTEVGEIKIDLPCCGVFEMVDGKIKVWRDYFDMATFTKPFGG